MAMGTNVFLKFNLRILLFIYPTLSTFNYSYRHSFQFKMEILEKFLNVIVNTNFPPLPLPPPLPQETRSTMVKEFLVSFVLPSLTVPPCVMAINLAGRIEWARSSCCWRTEGKGEFAACVYRVVGTPVVGS